jgi:hypothetical protein
VERHRREQPDPYQVDLLVHFGAERQMRQSRNADDEDDGYPQSAADLW